MPMILLAIRIEMEVIFKMNFPLFMENSSNQETTMRLANGVITEVLDPSMYYSRLSFLESGKEAIDIKHRLGSKSSIAANNGFKLPNNKNKYYTRSALVKNLIPNPSEGRVRALFNEQSTKQSTFARIGQSTILAKIDHLEAIFMIAVSAEFHTLNSSHTLITEANLMILSNNRQL
eukprot:CAMPEP_0176347134 /NCGR_PEP_ID=MMETSP0126-20121128/6797_1 /TAXON_ID=141414 ORGANISM="Strombidinopsis acuminatum, Strain SPMC142" /NCGR_SAMPLE_ID=MMETSP0126 /ASSEMBLY_ACC=CAM_ASM_000229 /LENGTH=175 /DNA_ID=CAMNT_0017695093 /DNA_START=1540 /DNA_END=2068 /DNA_ORIENTATION=+